jgi:hypothetical protein
MGHLFANGEGVLKDYSQAAYWYRKAAQQGNASAQGDLGMLYDKGLGVAQDYTEAATWYRKAADQGIAAAQAMLGNLYVKGLGVTQDYAQAYFWFDLAAAGKIDGMKQEDVAQDRDNAASHLTPVQLSQMQEKARKWFAAHTAF